MNRIFRVIIVRILIIIFFLKISENDKYSQFISINYNLYYYIGGLLIIYSYLLIIVKY
jgi:hypothetical protein